LSWNCHFSNFIRLVPCNILWLSSSGQN
jgi:hypothetical protein